MDEEIKYYLSDMYIINIEYISHNDMTRICLVYNRRKFVIKEFKNSEMNIDELGTMSDILENIIKIDFVKEINDIVKEINDGIYKNVHALSNQAERIEIIQKIKYAKYYFKYSRSAFDDEIFPGGTMEDYWDTEKQKYKEILNNYKNGGKENE